MEINLGKLPVSDRDDVLAKVKRNLDIEYKLKKQDYDWIKKEVEYEEASLEENYIYSFYDEVNEESVGTCMDTLDEWVRRGAEEIRIKMNCPGGICTDGFALHDFICELRKDGVIVDIIGYGLIASMASIIIQAGTTRIMSPNSVFMMHNVVWYDAYWQYRELPLLEDDMDWDKYSEMMGNKIIAERSGWDPQELHEYVNRRRIYLPAPLAKEKGFIDEVLEI